MHVVSDSDLVLIEVTSIEEVSWRAIHPLPNITMVDFLLTSPHERRGGVVARCRDLSRSLLPGEGDVQVDGGALPRVQGMGHVGRVVDVVVPDGVHQGQVRQVALALHAGEAAVLHLDAHVLRERRPLLVGEVGEEGGALDGRAVVEVDAEQVVLGVRRQRRVHARVVPVAQARDGRERLVVDGDVARGEVGLPAGEGGVDLGARGGGVGAVDEGDDVGVEGRHLAHEPRHVGEVAEDAERLVGVLVAVAPGAPEDGLAPVLLQARGGGEDVAQARGEDDAARREHGLLARGVGHARRVGGVAAVRRVLQLRGRDGAVDHGDRVVVGQLRAGEPAVVLAGDACSHG